MGLDAAAWDEIIADLPGAHLLQTWEWGELKQQVGWRMLPQVWRDDEGHVKAAAMLLKRPVSMSGIGLPVCILYTPRGPLLDWNDRLLRSRVLQDLQALARNERAIFIKMDPELILGKGVPGAEDAVENPTGEQVLNELQQRGWHSSNEQVQFRNTVWMDITQAEDTLLARMHQKTRYNLRLAQRKGVRVEEGTLDDMGLLYRMYAETSLRDGFIIRPEAYYRQVWQLFYNKGWANFLLAKVNDEVVAGLVLFHFAGKAWYFYGMSTQQHREAMPNYLLQWEAVRCAKQHGCHIYDLWGAPEEFNENDSMWGVYRFKEGLGGQVVRTAGAWDFPVQALSYRLYTRFLPQILDIMRRRRRDSTRQEVSL